MNTTKDSVHYIVKNYGFLVYNIGIILWAVAAFLVGSGHEVTQEMTANAAGEFDLKYGTTIGLLFIGGVWLAGNLLLLATYFATKPDNRLVHA